MEVATQVLSHRDFLKIDKDYEAAASVAHLVYVCDSQEGIRRIRKGSGFCYKFRGHLLHDEETLARIKKLAIPPAWAKVWISPSAEGHIQATGFDVRGRKQYKYHPRWTALQQETKFHRMIEFGKALPLLREQLDKDLNQSGFPESKVIAMIISLMDKTHIRVGNEGYEKLYGSFGLTTLKNNHVNIHGDRVIFSFKGKKGIYHKVQLKSRKFARIIRQCKAIPGKELFQYYDENGEHRKIDSGQVNQYLKNCLGMDFTSKDFRTWAGTLNMISALRALPPCKTKMEIQKNITACLQLVSSRLGNTVTVCKKYYVHPEVINLYRVEKLNNFLNAEKINHSNEKHGLSEDERILMNILHVIAKTKVELSEIV
jgi:DNA topoisomerase-1